MNTRGTFGHSVTVGLPNISETRRELIALRNRHGASSPIGARCSNLVELMQMPEIPTRLVARQMADLQRLLGT